MSGGDCELNPNGSLLFPEIAWEKNSDKGENINENCTNDNGL